MIKQVGSVMIFCVFSYLGWKRMNWYQKRCGFLSDLIHAVSRMEAELSGRETETETLLRQAGEGTGPASELFRRFQAKMGELGAYSLSQIWNLVLQESSLPLKEEERQQLARLGQILGRYDGQLQAGLLAGFRRELEQTLETARLESTQQGKTALTLGCTIGMLLVILLN